MIGYILLCYVDTQVVSHNKTVVNDIVHLINRADIVASEFTMLFKNDDFESIKSSFEDCVEEFMNDPLCILSDEDEDDDLFEYYDDDDYRFQYGPEYKPLFLQFVTSWELFTSFLEKVKKLKAPGCQEVYIYTYSLSCLDQMELLRKLQSPANANDVMQRFVVSDREEKNYLLNKVIQKRKN